MRLLYRVCVPVESLRVELAGVYLSAGQYNSMMATLVKERAFTLCSEPVPGFVDAIHHLQSVGWRVSVVTARKGKQRRWAKEWLQRQGINGVRVYSCGGFGRPKSEIVRRLRADVVVDDRLDVLEELASALPCLKLFLLSWPFNQGEPAFSQICRITSWQAIVDYLLKATA